MTTVKKNQTKSSKLLILVFCILLSNVAFSQVPNYLSPNSLVGYWPFNGNANDVSGNGNNAILSGVSLTTDREGNPGSAYHFANSSDLITIPGSFYTPLDSNFTISFWFKSNFGMRMDIFNLSDSGLFQSNFNMILNDGAGINSNGINAFWNSGGINNVVSGTGGNYTNNEWHNILICRDGGLVKLYVDGIQSNSTSVYTSVIGINNAITLSNALFPFYGDIDDLIIYDRAVTVAEINDIVHNSNVTPYITSPKITDSYFVNDTIKIKWVKASGYNLVKIQYSLNNGVNWQMIANNVNIDSLTYSWIAPNMPGAECIIKITDVSNPTKFAISNKFLISKYQWQLVNDSATFSVRDGVKGYSFNNKMFLMGGWNPNDSINYPVVTNNEVWESVDGNNWTLIDTADWESRHCFGGLVHNNKMWVIGGDQIQDHFQNDVWNTVDGLNWTKLCDSVPWGNRATHMACSFDGKIWVMGGQKIISGSNTLDTEYNDVWNSIDGITWNLVTDSAAWNPRGQISEVIVFNNKMWIIGGGTYNWDRKYYNDVWSSSDGINWTLVTHQAPWAAREFHEVIVYNNAMWIIGGYDGNTGNRKDVWYSEDGATWHELKNTPWPERHACAVLNYDQSLWVIAGNMWNDSWRLNTLVCPNVVSPVATTTVLNGNMASFVANYSSAQATYKWQIKNGQVWQNLTNSALINGANNDTLKINTVSMINNGQQYRCVVESGACSDSTSLSVLNVLLISGIKETLTENSLSVFPNPASELITVNINNDLLNSNFTILDQLGRPVLTGQLYDNTNLVNIERLSPGYYILVINNKNLSYKLIKL
ncbi:MAG: LamG-like jellyroll fold domain-containing protein [Bacteroidota bacterium]|nr:LamG-like jellyroll fold domain-containing protein [Bacteroidota bacterium]